MILSFGKLFNQFLTDSSIYSNCNMDRRDLCFWRSRVVMAASTWELRALTCLFLFSFLIRSIRSFLYKIKIKANLSQLMLLLHFYLLLPCFRRTFRPSASPHLPIWNGVVRSHWLDKLIIVACAVEDAELQDMISLTTAKDMKFKHCSGSKKSQNSRT